MNSTNTFRLGVAFAVASAFTFGMSGPFAKSLMEAGWSPIAAVAARMAGGAVVMALAATILHRGWLREAIEHAKTVVLYGLVPIAGAQLCYYNAVAHLSVGVALLLEYLAPVLVVGWIWGTTRRRPRTLTLVGAGLALAGTVVVLDVFSSAHIDAIGVAWALGAAICAACYFVMSDRVAADGNGLNSVTLAAGGLVVGAAAVFVVGLTGVLPLTFTTHDTVVAGHTTSFLVPVVVLGVVSTAMAYVFGISGVARLRPSYASLLGLAEVLCAVVAAWVLLGEAITAAQAAGGAVVLLGLALAGQANRSPEVTAAPLGMTNIKPVKAVFASVLAAGLLLIAPASVPSAAAAPCPDVQVVFARGTNEPVGIGRVGQAFSDALGSQLGGRTLATYAVNYPASLDFMTTATGAADASSYITTTARQCPSTRIVLGGYSQGAAVMDMLGGLPPLGDKIGEYGSAPPLSPDVASRIAAVAVFGNPATKFGNPMSGSPLFGAKSIDLCNNGDPICSKGRNPFAHTSYESTEFPDQAASFVAGLV